MVLAFAIDFGVALLTAFLLDRLRRSQHPLARKLLRDVGSTWNPALMSHAQVRAFALRFLLFGLATCIVAGLVLVVSSGFPSNTLKQVGAEVAGVAVAVVAILSLINAGHFALIAFSRCAEARNHVHVPTVPPVRPE